MAATAVLTPSGSSFPVSARFRPRPASTFSLKIGVGERSGPVKTTRRTEFDPTSTTAIYVPADGSAVDPVDTGARAMR
jgi:hypothetical protein